MPVRRLLAKITSRGRHEEQKAAEPATEEPAEDAPMTRDEGDEGLSLGFSMRTEDDRDKDD